MYCLWGKSSRIGNFRRYLHQVQNRQVSLKLDANQKPQSCAELEEEDPSICPMTNDKTDLAQCHFPPAKVSANPFRITTFQTKNPFNTYAWHACVVHWAKGFWQKIPLHC